MTPKQKARLDYHNYEAGLKHGTAVAQAITERFPDGFSDEQCTALTSDINQSRQSAVDTIPKRFREAFSAGYYVGIRATIEQHRELLVKIIIGKK